jgi:hypothetical protein
MWGLLRTTPAGAIRLSSRASVAAVLGGTILLQGTAVALLVPGLSDDLFRYRLDGRMWLAGVSPYATAPRDFQGPRDELDARVPFAAWRTIYPPVSQGVFVVARVADDWVARASTPNSTWTEGVGVLGAWRAHLAEPAFRPRTIVFRALFALFVVAGVGVLMSALRREGRSVWGAALVGFNPLVTLEVGGMGHQDAIGLFLIALTLWAAARRRLGTAAVGLALATAVKPLAALMLPFLYRQAHEEQSFRAGRRAVGIFAVTLAIALPPLLVQRGWVGFRETAQHFGEQWEGNAFLYETFKAWAGPGDQGRQMVRAKDAARLLSMLAVLLAGLLLWQGRARLAEAGYWLFMVLLLTAPVAYPWYVIWPLVMVPMMRRGGAAALVWSATAGMAYTAWRNAPASWGVPGNWLAGEYLPVLGVLALEIVVLIRSCGRPAFVAVTEAE